MCPIKQSINIIIILDFEIYNSNLVQDNSQYPLARDIIEYSRDDKGFKQRSRFSYQTLDGTQLERTTIFNRKNSIENAYKKNFYIMLPFNRKKNLVFTFYALNSCSFSIKRRRGQKC